MLISRRAEIIGPKGFAGRGEAMLRLRVLLAEDHAESARTVTLLLRRWGHEVRVVHDGRLALEAALREPFDAILLDIDLPGLDGFEIADELRRRPQFDSLPLIATTGHAEEEYRLRAMAAGFDQYLLKPLSSRALHTALDLIVPAARQ